jgi:hypothetical protein
MEYHKTKDIMHVKYFLGHIANQCTLIYANLEQATFLTESADDEWICRAATTKEVATSIVEGGFQYVTDIDGVRLFRKLK